MLHVLWRIVPMVKFTAAATLILVPLLWGSLMVPILDFIEKWFKTHTGKNYK